ncbi:hypothetical protein T03_7591, partial [Trichinella britovi]
MWEYVQHLRRDLERVYEVVRKKAGREQRRQKAWKDRKAYGPVYEPGDLVWMQLPTKTKLGAYWDGPYQVQRKLDWNTYRVEKVGGGRERLVVHFDRLKPYHGTREGDGAQGRERERRKTRRPAWLRDFIQTQEVSTGRALHEGESGAADTDRANEIFPAENEDEDTEATVARGVFVFVSSSTLVSDCLIKYISIVCCFVVAMPSGKRETERKVNAPVNTGPSPNSDERVNNPTEGADEPARGSVPLHILNIT